MHLFMMSKIKVLFVASEIAPYAKTGGLADVSSALPIALKEKGIDVILEIEIEGATNIKKLIPEAIFIFIMPPSLKTLVKRLKGRGTESNDKIIKRFHEAYKEINEVTKYNYVVVNDEIQDTVNTIEAIIKAEKCRVDRIEEVYLDTKEEEIHELLMQEDFDNQGLSEKID